MYVEMMNLQSHLNLCACVCVRVFVCKSMVEGNRRKRRGDEEKDCCVGEVLTCLFGSCVSSANYIILLNYGQCKHV